MSYVHVQEIMFDGAFILIVSDYANGKKYKSVNKGKLTLLDKMDVYLYNEYYRKHIIKSYDKENFPVPL